MQIFQELMQYVPILPVLFFCAYVFWRQRKEQKRRQEILSSLIKGDHVITIGGMYGTITALHDKVVTLRVSEKVEIDFARDSISNRQFLQKNELMKKQRLEKDAKRPNKSLEQIDRTAENTVNTDTIQQVKNTDSKAE